MNTNDTNRPRPAKWTIDAHAHAVGFLPGPVRGLRRLADRGLPAETPLSTMQSAKLDGVVACAVGDALVTRWWRPRTAWRAVLRQLDRLRAEAHTAGCRMVTRHDGGASAVAVNRTSVFLGLEGADAIGADLDRILDLDARDVRVIGMMHYTDNAFGTICMDWTGRPCGSEVAKGRRPGLTGLGKELVSELESRAILVDLAHADTETIQDVCARARRPVLCSHTGAAAIHEFPRYLTDHDLEAIATTGGVIGLWPYRDDNSAMSTIDDFARHAEHIVDVVGIDHICLGTDTNGVPRLIHGFDGPEDIPKLLHALSVIGFTTADIAKVAGANIARLLLPPS